MLGRARLLIYSCLAYGPWVAVVSSSPFDKSKDVAYFYIVLTCNVFGLLSTVSYPGHDARYVRTIC
jgi:hypothetical protein